VPDRQSSGLHTAGGVPGHSELCVFVCHRGSAPSLLYLGLAGGDGLTVLLSPSASLARNERKQKLPERSQEQRSSGP
jgi:hypothetical protein